MALTQIAVPVASSGSSATPQPDKQIAGMTTSSNTLLYEVPTGRKAEVYFGHQYSGSNNNDYYVNVDVGGTYVRVQGGLSGQSVQYRSLTTPLVTLLAGSRVLTHSSNSGEAYILGVESDA